MGEGRKGDPSRFRRSGKTAKEETGQAESSMEETAEKESDSSKIIVATLIVLVVLFAFTFYMAWNEIPTLDDMEGISWPTNGTATLLPVPG